MLTSGIYYYADIEEQKHIAAIEEAIKNKGKLDHGVMQGVFLGSARSGKSSLIKRLLREKVSMISPSTGAAEKIIQVGVKKSSGIATSVFESTWMRLNYSSEALRLMVMIEGEKDANQSASDGSRLEQHIRAGASATYNAPKQVFESALRSKSFGEVLRSGGIVALRKHFDGSWSLYISDTGGQMEFQEILPLLVSGPSLFFIVFPLHRDLNERFMIEYQLSDGRQSQPYQSTLTLKEAILQSLATIAAMGTFTYKGMSKGVELKPKVLLVGTHKDLLDSDPLLAQKMIEKIDGNLQKVITSMSYYRDGLVEFATEKQLIFTVNNFAKDDSDFARIRSKVNAIATLPEYQMSIPTHWLIFSLVLRGLESRVISFAECFKQAQQCGIDSEEELHEVLWFLHTKMGVIRYFRHGDVRNVVVIDPQLLFDKVTELIIRTFTFDKGTRMREEFIKKGIFSFTDFLRIATEDSLLTHSRFVELLKHLRILVPFHDGKKMLVPCVWTHADKALYPPKQHSEVPTLAIVFDCGYCPKGVTGALVKYLMTNEMESGFTWKLQTDQIFRDQATFFVGPHLVTLCMYPTHFEVVSAPSTAAAEAVCGIKETCREVCQTIQKGIHTVSRDINLTCHCHPSFYCTLCKSHIAEVVQHRGIPCQLWCDKTRQFCDFPKGYHHWIEGPSPKEAKQKVTPAASSTLTLPSAYKLVFTLGAQWKNLGLFLDVDIGTLDKIERDYKTCNDCLREMLCTWLKAVDPQPSWQGLASAVESFDQTVAEKIRNTCCN